MALASLGQSRGSAPIPLHGVARRPLNRQKATWTNPSKIKSRPLATTADTTLIPKA
jgi:hypothetical protein